MESEHPVILFDGVCNLCNASVQFILRNDRRELFRFTSLQSETAARLLGGPPESDSIILIMNGRHYYKSTAALLIAARLRFPWPVFSVFLIVPPFIRNFIYSVIAKNRYRWFGKKPACMIPDKRVQHRFI
jgi:predicted DCC family thiol-disulfide oxidoreductase YuxK